MSTTTYTTWGEVRGCCCHSHRSYGAARACLDRDRQGCRSHGGYSDREVRAVASAASVASYDVTRGPGEPAPS